MTKRVLGIVLAGALLASAQQAPPATPGARLLTEKESRELYTRTIQLMEAGGFAIPDLARAGLPLIENVKQTIESLQFLGWQNPTLHYRVLTNVRAYLLVSDAVPKPVPFPEQSRKQLAELRDNAAQIESYFQALVEQIQRQLRAPDRDQIQRYSEANSTMPPPNPANPRVVFMGDSITDGWRLNEYFTGKDFVNRGISGQITSQMLARMLPDVIALKPQAMIVLAGTNDIARGVAMKTIQNNLEAMADLADKHGIKVIFATVLPISDYHKGTNPAYERSRMRPPGVINELNGWIKSFCEKRGYVLANYFDAIKNSEGMLPADAATDGLHPNAQGYRVMAPVALAAIEKTLNPPQPERRKRRLF